MIAPQLAAQRFLWACLTGATLGAVYDFLRPLRPRRTALSDVLFLLAAFFGWLFLHFKLCAADIRLPYSLAMLLGGFGWEWTAGTALRPVFSAFWMEIGKIWEILTLPLKIFSKKTKILFASGRKWVTIKWNNRRHNLSKIGGKPYGRFRKNHQHHHRDRSG